MRNLSYLSLGLALLLFSMQINTPVAQATPLKNQAQLPIQVNQSSFLTDQLIIKFKTTSGANAGSVSAAQAEVSQHLAALSNAAGLNLTYARAMSGDAEVLKLPQKMTQAAVEALAEKLMANAAALGIESAEPDAVQHILLTPNDSDYTNQWDYQAPASSSYGINLPNAWDITTGSSSVVVAVIDTGIRFNHPDLSGRTVPGYDFVSDDQVSNDGNGRDSDPSDPGDWVTNAESQSGYFQGCDPTPSSWHGSHVAGIIGAASNNGIGMAGINWSAKLLPVRVLGKCGGMTSDIIDGMRWAAGIDISGVPHNSNPAKVINISLGGSGRCSFAEQSAINDVVSRGAVVVVAAGNENQNASNSSPANCNNVISVAATDHNGNRAFYSDYGTVIKLSAPGGGNESNPSDAILSTVDTGAQGPQAPGYANYIGTSMATPHVTGVVSLMFSLDASLTPAQVLQLLQANVTRFPSGSTCTTANCGAGIVNAAAVLQAVQNRTGATPSPTAAATATPVPTTSATPTFVPTVVGAQDQRLYLPLVRQRK